jgi:hypothetical protein
MVKSLPHEKRRHYYNTIKMLTEFQFIPLHFLALLHQETTAIAIGCTALSVFLIGSWLLRPFEM